MKVVLAVSVMVVLFAGQVSATPACSTGYVWSSSFNDCVPQPLVVSPAIATVPEPSIIALFALGLVGIGFARRHQS
jgi:hypothetical protein